VCVCVEKGCKLTNDYPAPYHDSRASSVLQPMSTLASEWKVERSTHQAIEEERWYSGDNANDRERHAKILFNKKLMD
jgi:hypothetical protein